MFDLIAACLWVNYNDIWINRDVFFGGLSRLSTECFQVSARGERSKKLQNVNKTSTAFLKCFVYNSFQLILLPRLHFCFNFSKGDRNSFFFAFFFARFSSVSSSHRFLFSGICRSVMSQRKREGDRKRYNEHFAIIARLWMTIRRKKNSEFLFPDVIVWMLHQSWNIFALLPSLSLITHSRKCYF